MIEKPVGFEQQNLEPWKGNKNVNLSTVEEKSSTSN